ncbi:MAG: DUF4003 family protein [Saccharofermentanales bacterium]
MKIEKGLQLIEDLYLELKPDFWRKNSFHGLAQVLALAGNVPELPARVESLRQAFREVNLRLDRENTMTTLGVLALLPQEPAEIVSAVQSACEYLRQHKRFGSWSVGKQELLLYAASLVCLRIGRPDKPRCLEAGVNNQCRQYYHRPADSGPDRGLYCNHSCRFAAGSSARIDSRHKFEEGEYGRKR